MASGYVDRTGKHISGQISNAGLSNGWTTNGLCFWEVTDDVAHAHYSIRNGTATDGTTVHQFGGGFTPTGTSLAGIAGTTGANGYAIIDTSSAVKVYGITNVGSVVFDIYWIL